MQTFELTVQEILDKQFNIDFKGYNAQEVDEFLDLVIHDYQQYDEKLKECTDTLLKYENTIESLKNQISDLQSRLNLQSEVSTNTSNLDVLRRLSRLETEVFKK